MSLMKLSKEYKSFLNLRETELAIKELRHYFQEKLEENLNLERVSAPLYVTADSGLNDDLNGIERPVSFGIKEQNDMMVQIVHSLAKWKRLALKRYGFNVGEGLYTDMNAIRRDEDTDNIHSLYVDQWDWEKVIKKEDRNIKTLKETVEKIYKTFLEVEKFVCEKYSVGKPRLSEKISFITSQELLDLYPDLTAKERERKITKEKGSVFIMQIGGVLSNGEKHDGRAPDYDDWSLNGDILVYDDILDIALELSSMGIRVDESVLANQLKISKCESRKDLPFQKALLNKELPYTVGGGIGQSRTCMFLLKKAHIGEVQASIWLDNDIIQCEKQGIELL